MTIWLLPIEPLTERYSEQWLRWWPVELRAQGLAVVVVEGQRLCDGIVHGQFLDAIDTHYYKATQLAEWLFYVQAGSVKDGDIVLFLDGWNPQVEAVAYVRDTVGPRVKIAGCLHAGTWDPHDFLTQRGLGAWASNIERGWFAACDRFYVATQFHRALLIAHGCPAAKIAVTGFPMYGDFLTPARRTLMQQKRPVVVFPHRLAPEKKPQVFDELREVFELRYGHIAEWVRTKDVWTTKDAYYDLLATSKVAVSTALQETWGIAMIEAAALGCHPVMPDRLSYRETVPTGAFYGGLEQAATAVYTALQSPGAFPYGLGAWEGAIGRVADDLRRLRDAGL